MTDDVIGIELEDLDARARDRPLLRLRKKLKIVTGTKIGRKPDQVRGQRDGSGR